MTTEWQTLFDWSGGLRNRGDNPLNFPPNALVAGENVSVTQGSLATRPGMSIVSTGSLPVGEVMALKQVRFPTNKGSFLVAQVRGPGDPGIDLERLRLSGHTAVTNPNTGTVLVFGGSNFYNANNESYVYEFFPTTGKWIEHHPIADPGNGLTCSGRYNHVAVWDPTTERMLVEGGTDGQSGNPRNDLWAYDPVSVAWICLIGQDVGYPYPPSYAYHGAWCDGDYLYTNGGIRIYNSVTTYRDVTEVRVCNLTTFVWTTVNCTLTGTPPVGSQYSGTALGSSRVLVDSGLVYSYGGFHSSDLSDTDIVIDVNGASSTWGDLIPNCAGIYGHEMNAYSGDAILSGGYDSDATLFANSFMRASIGQPLEAAPVTGLGTAPNRMGHACAVVGNLLVVIGGRDPRTFGYAATAGYNDVWMIDLDTMTVVPYSVEGSPTLWASPDHLPTTTAAFTELYQFQKDCGVVSVATLNDRCIITEGITDPVLDWGGGMTTTGADWLVPKAVLVSQDGENYYDITPQVCDADPDTTVNIGNIRADGFVVVCTDMPKVDAFYFEVGTPNTVPLQSAAGTAYSESVDTQAAADVTWMDLKGAITTWVQDSGATGHFTDGATTLSLGAGNDCPDVEVGVVVTFAAGDKTILSITGDGTGSGAVTLSATQVGATVNTIHGLIIETSMLTMAKHYTSDFSTWSVTPSATQGARMSGYSIRQIIPAADISASGTRIRLTIKTGPEMTTTYGAGNWYMGNGQRWQAMPSYGVLPVMINRVSIVERDGSTGNGTGVPTEVTFTASGSTVQLGSTYSTPEIQSSSASTEYRSDSILFDLDETKDYIVTMDILDVWGKPQPTTAVPQPPLERAGNLCTYGTTTAGYYYRAATAGAGVLSLYDQQTVTGMTYVAGTGIGVIKVETDAQSNFPTQQLVAHTTDTSNFDVSKVESFQGVTTTESTLDTSTIYHAISLDVRQTFQVFTYTGDPLVGAWRTIVKLDTVWKYLDATDTWQSAAEDSLLGALRQAFAVTENQMDKTELEAITAAQWIDTGGIVLHISPRLDFAVGMTAGSFHVPALSGYSLAYNDIGTTTVTGYKAGIWDHGSGWTDGTQLSDVPFGQSGIIDYAGSTAFEADYHVENEVPGFWYKFKTSGTSAGTTLSRILYKAPCQPLANIGDGQPDTVQGCVFHDTSADLIKDYSVQVSDNVETSLSMATVSMAPADFLYIGYYLPFNELLVTPHDVNNAVVSTLTAQYWNGEAWTDLPIVDGTAGTTGKTFSKKSKISWTAPDDWRMSIPIVDTAFTRSYWMRFSVSAQLTAATAITEVRVYAVPPTIAKHRIAAVFRDRLSLLGRPDAPDQCDVSRQLEEYGFMGADSGSYRVGGSDEIQCAIAAWNSLFLGKIETWHQITGSTPEDFQFQSVEAARCVPINTQVIVKAPVSGLGDENGSRQGLYFINRYGMFASTGLQVDSTWNTSRGGALAEQVNWWLETSLPRLDLNCLHKACGEYWPLRNWLVWSVPMIVTSGQTSQTTNNRLIVYDLAIKAWLPPFTAALSALCTGYDYCATAHDLLGPMAIYGGTYDGRVVKLFDGTTDLGTAIACSVETGPLHFNSPQIEKDIKDIYVYTDVVGTITLSAYLDQATTPEVVSSLSTDVVRTGAPIRFQKVNITGARFVRFKLDWSGPGSVYGLHLAIAGIRDMASA